MGEPAGGSPPRVRFAPSPTGFLHVGSARAALFNWLFARHHGGTFILRIEDTDTERGREEWVEGILSSLAWLGMEPDEGPFRQSARTARYEEAIAALWGSGALYACDCTAEDVARRTAGGTPGYDGYCRDRGLERAGHALRFRVPDEGEVVVHDLIRGEVDFPLDALADFVVVKSNGDPLFVLANVVDDLDMAITHAIRGEDLLSTTPRGLLLWDALGYAGFDRADRAVPPVFAHLPLLVNEQRQKLSKRRDTVAVEAYREEGYLAEAMRNYLALLGWSPPDGREILPIEDIVAQFRLEDVHHAPAFFDVRKLTHVNKEYVKVLVPEAFVERCRPWLEAPVAPWPPERFDPAVFARMAPLVQERVDKLDEVPGMVDFLFLAAPAIDEGAWQSVAADESAGAVLQGALSAYRDVEWSAERLHEVTAAVAESVGLKLAKAQAPIRVAVTGKRVGPPLFQSMEVLGRDEVTTRLTAAFERLGRSAA